MARIESSVTSVSWIPWDAMEGVRGLITDLGVGHWDLPPPDQLENLDELIDADAIRFANDLRAWVEVEGGHITRYGHLGNGRMGQSTLVAESRQVAFAAVALPDLRPDPEVDLTSVRFVQTTGGRTGVPLPRHIRRRPFVQLTPPTVWTTLALTIHADGSSRHEVVGASPFPRHWIYDHDGTLVAKTGLIDFTRWLREASGQHTPWGHEDSPALMTAVESALERRLSRLMREARLPFRRLAAGATLMEQGTAGREIYIVLDGLLAVEVDGQVISEVGPGAFLGGTRGTGARRHARQRRAGAPARPPEAGRRAGHRLGGRSDANRGQVRAAAVRSQRGGDCGGDSRQAVPAGRAAVARGRGPGVYPSARTGRSRWQADGHGEGGDSMSCCGRPRRAAGP